jgi:polysaccharide deacetylase family protein (PEP-CTERM system associated)
MLNFLTIDIEDYFQVHAFSKVIKYESWKNHECRIERNTNRLLEILNSSIQHSTRNTQNLAFKPPTGIHATFFILGWIAERYPGLIRNIKEAGHEIACHGYAHQLIYSQSKDEFREDIRKAKGMLEDITGEEVIGYRAPSYSITNKSQWAFQVLIEEGFKYDSSIFPVRHDFYGMPNAPRFPFLISQNGNKNVKYSQLNVDEQQDRITGPIESSGRYALCAMPYASSIVEFPLSTVRLFGQNLPISGGGYFRLFPYPLIVKGLKRINEKESKPFIFYLHPWEIDPDQPRIGGAGLRSTLRHYVNLNKTENRFKMLLKDFQFSSIKEMLLNAIDRKN